MKRVYIVDEHYDHGVHDVLVGVFSSVEKAKASRPDARWHKPRPRADWYIDPAVFPWMDAEKHLFIREVVMDRDLTKEGGHEDAT